MTTPRSKMPNVAASLASQLTDFQVDRHSQQAIEVQQALFLARRLQERAAQLQSSAERRQQAELDRLLQHPEDKVTLIQITDEAFRSHRAERAADQMIHILDVQGIPRFFSRVDQALLKGFQTFGSYLPGVAVPLVEEKMHRESANVVLPAEEEMLTAHLCSRRAAGVRMNVNYLGEALLDEEEAARRLQAYLQALQLPEIEVMSVKISTIYSQISALAREHTIRVLCDRLELLYRAASRATFKRSDDTSIPKFVYLDMEEYRDLEITAEAFMRTLDRPGLAQARAGIALQAYIPDSFPMQQRINAWARERIAAGGAPVTIRIVKGANMEMERVEASLQGWPQAPYKTKLDTDANYKRMVREGMRRENLAAVRLGIASHNLFDLAYGIVLANEHNALDRVQFEMLEGMANHQRRALCEIADNVLLYAPACRHEHFIHAIGYLIRRLDENTGPENFLRHAFHVRAGSNTWQRLEAAFVASCEQADSVSAAPRRQQDRRREDGAPTRAMAQLSEFVNEPDTDFSLPHHADWGQSILDRWIDQHGQKAVQVPLVIAGKEVFDDRTLGECRDPSRPGMTVGHFRLANRNDIELAVAEARADADGWRIKTYEDRRAVLAQVACELRRSRGELMGAAVANGGKTLLESDAEVSEAIDFAEFYSLSTLQWSQIPGTVASGRGVVAVVSPWNFPIAIPCGGICAALAAGNTVLLKPASDAVLVAYELCQCFWRAGVSQRTLQFVPCRGATEGEQLATHDDIDTVILTGGTATALALLAVKPTMHLLAETGGKNATIVTALADRDQAIKHVLHSAFSHSGQKCSATSLLILEAEVYEDPDFRRALCSAVESIPAGSAWQREHRLGPLIRPPSGALERSLKELEPGESWAVLPRQLDDNPNRYSPGVKWNVQPGSFTHMTELFGPVLGVMKAKDLHEAISFVNATGYGLTSGLESLDDREQQLWRKSIRAGNLYINRSTTGAIVLRQPFGGMGKSSVGPGIKAGGPNYVAKLMQFHDVETDTVAAQELPANCDQQLAELLDNLSKAASSEVFPTDEWARLREAIVSYALAYAEEFGCQHDHFRLIGQDNLRRYLPVACLRVRADPRDAAWDVVARIAAAKIAGCRITLSYPPGESAPLITLLDRYTESWAGGIEFLPETDEQLAGVIRAEGTDRVRYAAADRVPPVVRAAAAQMGFYLADAPVSGCGRLELLWYVREQSVCSDYHRYGNLVERAGEERAETL